jgi:hypothetical protein
MAQILDLGKIRFSWNGTYSNTTEYEYNDLVKYGPNLYAYISNTAATGVLPTNTTNWALVSEGLNWRGTYSASTLYYKNDVVTDGTSTFIVTVQHTSTNSPSTSSNSNLTLLALGQEGLPAYTGNSNKVLTNNGSNALWTDTTLLAKTYVGTNQGAAAETFETNGALSDVAAAFAKSTSNFAQLVMINPSNGANASTDFIAYTADGDNNSGWIDLGITSNNFSATNFGITGPHDGYIFMSAPRGTEKDISAARVIGTVATLTTTTAHGYSIGNIVKIEGVDAGGGTGLVDQLVTITAVSSTTFSFTTNVTPFSETNLTTFGTTFKPKGDGNLVLATDKTGLQNKIIIAAGGYESGTTQMEITPDEQVDITISTASTSPTTGALTVAGGAGFGGKVHTASDLQTFGKLFIGEEADNFTIAANLTDPIAVAAYEGSAGSFAQVAIHNSEPTSSTDILLYPDNGDDGNGWMDLGVTGSTFEQAEYGITTQNEGYIFFQPPTPNTKTVSNKALSSNTATLTTSTAHGFLAGQRVVISGIDATFNGTYTIASVPTTTTFTYAKTAADVSAVAASGTAAVQSRGNMVIATGENGTDNKIIFAAGGFDSGLTQMSITPDQNVHIEIATPSTSPTTGALTVVGGVGITGDVNVAGNITFGGTGTQVSTANLAVSAPMIFTGSGSTVGNYDLGLVTEGKYQVTNIPVQTVINKEVNNNVAILTTLSTHNFAVGDSVSVANVDSTFNGTYTITAVDAGNRTFSYAKTTGNIASARIGAVDYTISNKALNNNVATLTTSATHAMTVGTTVFITGVDSTFNGTYTVTGVTTNTFSYAKTASNVTATSATGTATYYTSVSTATVSSATRTRWSSWFKNDADGVWNLVSNISTLPVTNIDLTQNTYGNGVDISYDTIKIGGLVNTGNSAVSGNMLISGTTESTGNFSVNTNKFNVTAASGNTTIAGTLGVTGNSTLTGDLAINGGDLTTTATTFNLLNDTATTINIAGGATALTIGSTTGTTTVRNDLATTGGITVNTNKFTVASGTGNTQVAGTLGVTGNTTLSGTLSVTGLASFPGGITVTGTERFTGRFDVQEMREDILPVTMASNVLTCDYTSANIFYSATAPSANWTLNLTNVPTDDNKSLSIAAIQSQGATGYVPTTFQIDGSAVTIKWAGGTAPTPTANKLDIFNFSLLRVGSAWQVLGSANVNF